MNAKFSWYTIAIIRFLKNNNAYNKVDLNNLFLYTNKVMPSILFRGNYFFPSEYANLNNKWKTFILPIIFQKISRNTNKLIRFQDLIYAYDEAAIHSFLSNYEIDARALFRLYD